MHEKIAGFLIYIDYLHFHVAKFLCLSNHFTVAEWYLGYSI